MAHGRLLTALHYFNGSSQITHCTHRVVTRGATSESKSAAFKCGRQKSVLSHRVRELCDRKTLHAV